MTLPRFIVVEGLDGTGKSTVAAQLAVKLGYHYMKTPSDTFQVARTLFDVKEIPTLERVAFYLGDCLKLSVQVQRNAKLCLVVDRYYYSTIAYHLEQDPDLIQLLKPFVQNFIKPDIIILLKADFEVSKSRIKARSEDPCYEDKFLNPDAFARILQHYQKLIDAPMMTIDNSGDLEETLENILQEIRNRFKCTNFLSIQKS